MDKVTRRLANFRQDMAAKSATMLGYPINTSRDYRPLYDLLDYSLINLGDPFVPSSWRINSEQFELEVLDFFFRLYRLPTTERWGYLTSGGTEGNTYGIFVGRQLYPEGLLYFSKDTHYSISKIARLLRIETVLVESQANGEIDYQDLTAKLKHNRQRPAILNLNLGTTMRGAVDDVALVVEILRQQRIKNFHIHCDAALFGMIWPFVRTDKPVDFRLPIGSLAISGHKFIGSHMPVGIVLARRQLVRSIETPIDYIGSVDSTISGCRNGHAPVFLWYAIKTMGRRGFAQEARTCLHNAAYLHQRLQAIGWPAWRNQHSNIVYFQKPPTQICQKWQLALAGDYAHVLVMQQVTREKIEELVGELVGLQ